jgi:hypothetical protein
MRFKSVCRQRVWGGRVLNIKLDRIFPYGVPYSESWGIDEPAEAQSVDEVMKLTLRELLQQDSRAIMGRVYDHERPCIRSLSNGLTPGRVFSLRSTGLSMAPKGREASQETNDVKRLTLRAIDRYPKATLGYSRG